MLKKDLIKLVEEKDAKIRQLENELAGSATKSKQDKDKFDGAFFDRAVAELENHSFGEAAGEVSAKYLVEFLVDKPKLEVQTTLYSAILDHAYKHFEDENDPLEVVASDILEGITKPFFYGKK